MKTIETVTPRDILTEAVADLLVNVGGYKDAAEATREAEAIFENLTSIDAEDVAEAATQLRVLAIQAQGATNALETAQNDDADQTFRFVAPVAGESLPEGPIVEAPQTLSELLESVFGVGNVRVLRPTPQPQPAYPAWTSGPIRLNDDRFDVNPFGGFSRAG